jgi:hypothetical protein
MRRGEDLEVVEPVSPRLLDRCEEIQAVYAAWDPMMQPIAIRARATAPRHRRRRPWRPRKASVAFFSRGVDSLYAAARNGATARERETLVFVDGLEPRHDDAVREAEIARARAAADDLGLRLVVTGSNVRRLVDPLARDWEDALGAGLAFLAHSLAGGARRALIPSGDDYLTVEPAGSSPLLDPLFSTESMTIEHDHLVRSRLEKVRWIARERPDLLRHLKVCFKENRADNCGTCGKCLLTMACLHLVGALDAASQFPNELDIDAIAAMKLPHLKARLEWIEVVHELPEQGADAALRDAILGVIRSSALDAPRHETPEGRVWVDPMSIRNHRLNATLSLVLEGKPYSPRRRPQADSLTDP